jgi:serine/threonine protein kinase
MVGSALGHYRILSRLGAGGMGEVYRAADTRLGREVALKVLPAHLTRDPERLARIEREARTLAALNHRNIVTVHSIEEAQGIRFLTMELVEGQTLDEAIPRGGLPLDRFLAIATALADALAAAHERGVVHRDLKPANVMLTRDGQVKVLDFGLAKLEEFLAGGELTNLPTDTVAQLSQEGHLVGTFPYMSPEQLQGRPVDHRSDVFALGWSSTRWPPGSGRSRAGRRSRCSPGSSRTRPAR